MIKQPSFLDSLKNQGIDPFKSVIFHTKSEKKHLILNELHKEMSLAINSNKYIGKAGPHSTHLIKTNVKKIRLAEVFNIAQEHIKSIFDNGQDSEKIEKSVYPLLEELQKDGEALYLKYQKSTRRWTRWTLKCVARYTPKLLKKILPACFSNKMESAEQDTFKAYEAYKNFIAQAKLKIENINQPNNDQNKALSVDKNSKLVPAKKELPGSEPSSVHDVNSLMHEFTDAWDPNAKDFDFSKRPFNLEHFNELLINHTEKFKKDDVNSKDHFGYIEKFDLDPSQNPQLYIRADLHGDLKSLIENVRSLQKEGLLDENYKCKAGVHLVFLGDYCDRGIHGTQVLEMLMALREENPDQVHLIRGNHEYTDINGMYSGNDKKLKTILYNDKARENLEAFYETMALTSYFSVDGDKREYIQCTHGLFEPSMDPAHLIDKMSSGSYVTVPRKRELSERIKKIAEAPSELQEAAKRISYIVSEKSIKEDITAYNWADISHQKDSNFGALGSRGYELNAQDIRHYLDLSSETHKVQMVFRGHQHLFNHLKHEDDIIVTTLSVGMDCPAYMDKFDQPDRAYIIQMKKEVKNWKKQVILRKTGSPVTDEIVGSLPFANESL